MNSDAITALATAATAVFVVVIPLYVEYRRRVHEATQAHLQEIKQSVFEHIHGLLSDHYLRILEFRDSFLDVASENVSPNTGRSTERAFLWRPVLRVRPPAQSLPRTLGDCTAIQEYEDKYQHLYLDAKAKYFGSILEAWEQLVDEFDRLAKRGLTIADRTAKSLEQSIGFPIYDEYAQQKQWVDYLRIAVFACGRLWGVTNGALGTYQEGAHWILSWYGDRLGQGAKEEIARCQAEVGKLLLLDKCAFDPMIQKATVLRSQASQLKQYIERLLQQRALPGRCTYTRVPYL